jgi:hypothetical protein
MDRETLIFQVLLVLAILEIRIRPLIWSIDDYKYKIRHLHTENYYDTYHILQKKSNDHKFYELIDEINERILYCADFEA